MSAPAVIAARERAGRVEAIRLGVRAAEPTSPAPGASAPLRAVPFRTGGVRAGGLEVRLDLAGGDGVAHLDVAARNPSDRPLRLESVVVGLRWSGAGARSLRFLRHGWQSWSFTGSRPLDVAGAPPFPSGAWLRGLHHALGAPPEDRAGWHESDLVTVVGPSSAGPCCLLGVLECGRAFGIVYAARDGEDVRLELELWVDAVLGPGEERALERVRVALGGDASELLEEFADAHGALACARVSEPFVAGWCSWYHFFHEVSEADVLRNLEALAGARDELPVEVVQLDDGYQRAVGDWLETNERFPRGLAPLAEEIQAAGFVPGLWTAPFCAVGESDLLRQHPEWLLRACDGEPHLALLHPQWAKDARVYALDPSNAEASRHLSDLFRSLVGMGFRYLKLDFLYAAAMQAVAADPGLSRAGRLRRGLEAIRAGAGDEAFLLGCGCPLGAAVGLVDGMRIGPDVAPAWRAAEALAIPGVEETVPATRSALRSILGRAWMHRRLWLNDPDCLMARREGSQLSDTEVRTLASAIAGSGGMFVFSDEVAGLARDRRRLVRDALAVARAVDGLGIPGAVRCPDLLDDEFGRRLVAASAEGAHLVRTNPTDAGESVGWDGDLLGEGRGGDVAPLLGTREPSLAAGGRLEFELDPHETSLVRVDRAVPLAVFCDFDGTFSVQDVGATLAQRHASERRPRVWARYERGEISAWEYNLEILHGLPLPRARVEEFLETVDLDPGARDLLAWCDARGVRFRVLSDGFDANLNRLQQLHGVRFAYDANHLRYEGGRWSIRPGYPNPACDCGTGTCKRGRIESYRAARPGVPLVHIGNGRVSDLCGALAADVAFAKDTLALELEGRGIPFQPFESLHDVIPELEAMLRARGPAGLA